MKLNKRYEAYCRIHGDNQYNGYLTWVKRKARQAFVEGLSCVTFSGGYHVSDAAAFTRYIEAQTH